MSTPTEHTDPWDFPTQVARVVADVKLHLVAIEGQAERIFSQSANSDAQRAVEAIRQHLPEAHAKLDSLVDDKAATSDDTQTEPAA